MPYTPESADIPSLVTLRPAFDNTGAIAAIPTHANYIRRVKNDADADDQLIKDGTTAKGGNSASWDQWSNTKQVTVAGIGTFTYRQVTRLLAKIADIEHDAIE